jgi:hypothetical protein
MQHAFSARIRVLKSPLVETHKPNYTLIKLENIFNSDKTQFVYNFNLKYGTFLTVDDIEEFFESDVWWDIQGWPDLGDVNQSLDDVCILFLIREQYIQEYCAAIRTRKDCHPGWYTNQIDIHAEVQAFEKILVKLKKVWS